MSFGSSLGLGAKYVIAPLLIPDHVIRIISRGILRRLIRPNAGRHRRHRPVDIAVAEEGESVALAARAVYGAVRRGKEMIVGPALQQLATVHNVCVGNGRCLDPLATLRTDR